MRVTGRGVAVAASVGTVIMLGTGASHAQTVPAEALVQSLREGGYVLVMRHASAPREVPDRQTANADNVKRERQLDEAGRADSAQSMQGASDAHAAWLRERATQAAIPMARVRFRWRSS